MRGGMVMRSHYDANGGSVLSIRLGSKMSGTASVSGRRQCYIGGSIGVEDIRSTFASTETLNAELLWTLQTERWQSTNRTVSVCCNTNTLAQ